MSTADTYPKRPSHFAHKFCRLLAKDTVANDIGTDACWLLAVIAHTEDAKGYRGAVSFLNGQLMAFCGFASEDKLDTVRKRAVEAGWLHYIHGRRGVAARYWVTIPSENLGKDDLPSDEREDKYKAAEPAQSGSQHPPTAGNRRGVDGQSPVDHRSEAAVSPQPESQHPPAAGNERAIAGELTGNRRGVDGQSPVDHRNSSSLHLDLHLEPRPAPVEDGRQTPAEAPKSDARDPPEPFDPLKEDERNRKLFEERWNASGLRKVKRLSHNLHGRLKALLLDAWWAEHYPAALERAGGIPWLRDGTGRRKGPYDVGEFLANDDECDKILRGAYDPHPPPGGYKPGSFTERAADSIGQFLSQGGPTE